MNPVALQRRMHNSKGVYQYTSVWVWCQGCEQIHPFRVDLSSDADKRADGSNEPTWTWNGSMEKPTFSPSLLVYGTVDTCDPGWKHFAVCSDDDCGHIGHAYLRADTLEPVHMKDGYEGERLLGVHQGHQRPPGNCHTFLTDGVWNFLDDCAHKLRGMHPLEPLPDWWLGK